MPRLTETEGLTDLRRDILRTVRDFVASEIIPVAGSRPRESLAGAALVMMPGRVIELATRP